MILDFLQRNWKISNFFNEMLPTIYIYSKWRWIGVRNLCISPNIISSWNTFCDLGPHCLQTLFYQLNKKDTSLNIIVLPEAAWRNTWSGSAMFTKSDKQQTSGKTNKIARLHALTPVTDVKWFGTRSTPVSLAWPGSNCLPVTSAHKR